MTQRLADIADFLAAHMPLERLAPNDLPIEGLSGLEVAGPENLSFLSNPKYLAQLAQSAAGCVIVGPAARQAAIARGACLVVEEPYYAFALLTQWWKQKNTPPLVPQIHPSACIDPSARLGNKVSVGAFAVIGPGAVIGEGVRIGAHAAIGADVHIGAHSCLAARVTVESACRLGQRCIVHSGAVIGADGFGFAPHAGQWVKIEQLGGVEIGDDVEIGANTCIDRGALQDTLIEDGVKLDNLVQIAHNVRIGAHSALAACVGVAGSAVLGKHCTVGGAAVVLGHLRLADRVHVSAASVVTRSLLQPGKYTGFFPIDAHADWEKNAVTVKQLHALRQRIKQAEKSLQNLQGSAEKA